mmetsp:Transcript_119529/g.338276  ORF Transcript_119529/g.338276 Transcript_119529/m.338276 type:complete len:507 (-) Transcript_119529:116-1636(-)
MRAAFDGRHRGGRIPQQAMLRRPQCQWRRPPVVPRDADVPRRPARPFGARRHRLQHRYQRTLTGQPLAACFVRVRKCGAWRWCRGRRRYVDRRDGSIHASSALGRGIGLAPTVAGVLVETASGHIQDRGASLCGPLGGWALHAARHAAALRGIRRHRLQHDPWILREGAPVASCVPLLGLSLEMRLQARCGHIWHRHQRLRSGFGMEESQLVAGRGLRAWRRADDDLVRCRARCVRVREAVALDAPVPRRAARSWHAIRGQRLHGRHEHVFRLVSRVTHLDGHRRASCSSRRYIVQLRNCGVPEQPALGAWSPTARERGAACSSAERRELRIGHECVREVSALGVDVAAPRQHGQRCGFAERCRVWSHVGGLRRRVSLDGGCEGARGNALAVCLPELGCSQRCSGSFRELRIMGARVVASGADVAMQHGERRRYAEHSHQRLRSGQPVAFGNAAGRCPSLSRPRSRCGHVHRDGPWCGRRTHGHWPFGVGKLSWMAGRHAARSHRG